mgnify:CR=1 FL=1
MSTKISKVAHAIVKKAFYASPQKGAQCSSIIKDELEKNKPSMIARFGSTEIKAILYPFLPWPFRTYFRNRIFSNMEILSGFFPSNEVSIRAFSKLLRETAPITKTSIPRLLMNSGILSSGKPSNKWRLAFSTG